ncbi:hypothetical protein AGR8A_Lc10247 [Agrobacterium fabrum str. J-07]|nr:hypothetical protein AGR8A_Lc10247 [Agrobacterium fabrum str. J-07]
MQHRYALYAWQFSRSKILRAIRRRLRDPDRERRQALCLWHDKTARVMYRIAKQESHGTKGSKNKNAREAGVEVFISGDIACITCRRRRGQRW